MVYRAVVDIAGNSSHIKHTIIKGSGTLKYETKLALNLMV